MSDAQGDRDGSAARDTVPPAGGSGPGHEQGTVGRGAFAGGILLGGAIAIGGFAGISELGLTGLPSIALEMLTVLAALGITTAIWRRSAAQVMLDSPAGPQDRGRE